MAPIATSGLCMEVRLAEDPHTPDGTFGVADYVLMAFLLSIMFLQHLPVLQGAVTM